MARIVIAGCGDVGTTLGLNLAEEGHQVWGLKRNPATLPSAIRPLAADLGEPESLATLPPDLDYVFYTAAAGGFSEERYRTVYRDGVANLLNALQAAGANLRRIFFTSSTSVYGQLDGRWVDEASPATSENFSGRCIRAGEERLWNGPYPATVVRFGGIYGPGRTRLLDSVRNGNATCTAGVYTNRIHRDDCAAVLRHLLALPEPAPLYLAVDDHPALQCEVIGWLAQRLGVPKPAEVAVAGETEGRPRSNKRCRNSRLKATGFRFRYPSYKEGYQALLEAKYFA